MARQARHVHHVSPSLTSQSVMSKTRAHHFHVVDDAMKGLPVSYRSQQSPQRPPARMFVGACCLRSEHLRFGRSQPGRTDCGSQEAPVTSFGFATRRDPPPLHPLSSS